LIHRSPATGLQGKFSLEYAVAATLLDGYPGMASFTDEAVRRPAAQDLLRRVEVRSTPGGDGLLAGETAVDVHFADGTVGSAAERVPPGAPDRPPSAELWHDKLAGCGPDVPDLTARLDWAGAADVLREHLPAAAG
jgi:2-methylcitrate dehydratase PrpD